MARHADRHEVNLIVGEAASMRAITKYGSLYALNKAVEHVETRLSSDKDVVSLPSHAVMQRARSTAHAHLERRAYETVLDDLLRDEPRLRSNGS